MVRSNVFRCSQLYINVFHQCEFHEVSMCLSRALMVISKHSVTRCAAQNLDVLGAVGLHNAPHQRG